MKLLSAVGVHVKAQEGRVAALDSERMLGQAGRSYISIEQEQAKTAVSRDRL